MWLWNLDIHDRAQTRAVAEQGSLGAIDNTKFARYAGNRVADRAFRKLEHAGYLRIRCTGGQEPHDVELARRQAIETEWR